MRGHYWSMWLALWAVSTLILSKPTTDPNLIFPPISSKPKLFYIMIGGFRWDYVSKQKKDTLKGFNRFLREGVRASWTHPLFPSLAYPTWTTLVTGQYAETHGIIGSHFYDAETKEIFSLGDANSTSKQKWWQSEPIWTTAEKAGMKTAQHLWARCDVPYDGVNTSFCKPYDRNPGSDIFFTNVMDALDHIKAGYDFVQVYTDKIDCEGHKYGPDSGAVDAAVREVDDVLDILMDDIEWLEMANYVNIVIVSDHGMTYSATGAIQTYEIDNYLDTSLVENIAEMGAIMNIKVPQESIQEVGRQLSQMQGVQVYVKEDIPESLHYKKGKYVHDIVLIAKKGYYVLPSNSSKQINPHDNFEINGAHGYLPEFRDMRGIFYGKGPAFREGVEIDPIHVVDVYQILTHILGLKANPHNGTWAAVQPAFRPEYQQSLTTSNSALGSLASAMLVFLLAIMAWIPSTV